LVKQLDKKKSQFLYTDEMLISRFQSGDENAYVELVNRYKDKLTNFVFYFLKDEEHSEDIVQETFIRLYEKKHYYKEIAKFSTWIYTIARNLANTELRKKSRTKIMYLSQMSNYKKDYDLKSSDPELNKNIENEFLMKEIHAAIDKLPENYKSVIILRDIQGIDYEQISNIIGVPLGTVKSRINRARLQLQVDLMDYQKE
jgi:RNA polymerase sigma-70 factor (ECF subfamily)